MMGKRQHDDGPAGRDGGWYDGVCVLNAMVTPVTATVQTIRNELYVITAILILLSFLISLVLSRRITRPLVETTQAAGAL